MKIFWALLTACAATVTSALVWAFAFHGLSPWGAYVSGGIGVLLAIIAFGSCQSTEEDRCPPSFWEGILLVIFALVSFRCFFWIIYPAENALCILSPYNLGDISLHLQLIRYCALGVPFWPESPLLSNSPLVYPVGVDLLNAIILLLGGDLLQSFVWMGSIGALLTAYALWKWGGSFGIAAFLFAGGAAGFSSLLSGNLDFTQEQLDWKNLFLSMFVTQRSFLYALPAGLGLLSVWRREFQKVGQRRTIPFRVQAGILGTLPLFNVHTFLFVFFVLVSYFLFSATSFIQKRALHLILVSALPGVLIIWIVSGGFYGERAFCFLPGWLQGEHPWQFWWNNFGVLPLLWGMLLFYPGVYRDPETRCIFLAASALFLVCCVVSIAPWPWDNTKWMLWSYLAIAPLLWKKLLSPLPFFIKGSACILLFFSGAMALVGGMRSPGYSLISLIELREVENSLNSTHCLARFASAPDYNHPIALSGRKRVAGYEGHLWSHGLPYKPTLEKLTHLMNGESDWKNLANELKADFLFWGPREEACYPNSKKPWLSQASVVSQSIYGIIYDLR